MYRSYLAHNRPKACRKKQIDEHPLCAKHSAVILDSLHRMRQRYFRFHTPLCKKLVTCK